jgi:hypothetical protein
MSCVFQNIVLPSPGGEGGGGSMSRKTQATALYSTYIESSLGPTRIREFFSGSGPAYKLGNSDIT